MGSGGQHGGETSSSSQRLFRHRRRPTTTTEVDTRLDHPPSVTSSQGQPHSLRIRTPQYLSTLIHPSLASSEESISAGTAPCGPVLAFDRYVVSATNDGRVCLYSIKVDSDPTLPEAVVELDSHSTLVGLVAAPAGVSLVGYRSTVRKELVLKPPDLLGHVVAISSEGDVHLLECTAKKVKNLYSWNTGTCNASCVTVRPDCNGQWRICLGYESGCLEEWQVSIPVRDTMRDETEEVDNNEEEERSRSNTTESDWKPLMRRVFPQLLCRGSFDMPFRSISSLGTMRTGQDEPKNHLIDKSSSTAYGNNKKDTTIFESHVNSQADDSTNETKVLALENGDENNRSGGTVNESGDFLAVCLAMNPQTYNNLGRRLRK